MEYQTFRGADVQEALFNVREALGTDALIESTRHVTNGQGGALGRTFVEIVAAPSGAPPAPALADPSGARLQRAPELQRPRAVALRPRFKGKASSLEDTAVGREIVQLRLMLDELSQGRPPKDRTRALLAAAGFEGA